MITSQLEVLLKNKFDIDSKLNTHDSLELNITKFSDIIRENFKGNKMIDESLL